MNSIAYFEENENKRESTINKFFKENKIGSLLRASNFKKEQGFSCEEIFKFVFTLVFSNKNLFRFLEIEGKIANLSKDVVYRFLSSAHHNWAKFLILLSSNIINDKLNHLTSEDRVNVLIIDDSTYDRNRSKNVELLARIFDHTTNKYLKGFQMLTLGWSDGNSFIPVAFNLMSSSTEKNRFCPINENIDKRTNGYKARKIALKKKTEVLVEMIKNAIEAKIPASYVLFDSWFAFPSVMWEVKKCGIDVIAMLKKMPNVLYKYGNSFISLERLYSMVTKKRGNSDILASVIVSCTLANGEVLPLKIVFVRNKNKKSEWLAIVSTDVELSDEEIVRIYGKRWDIEVFFKVLKSHLKLAKEFQCRSFDSLVAHTTIVFTRYIMLSVQRRNTIDHRTVGGLFFACIKELDDLNFSQAINFIIELLVSAVKEILFATKEQIQALLTFFIESLPNKFKSLECFSRCES